MHQTFEDFNWTGVVLAIVLLIAMIYWYLPAPWGAKHFFKGPKREDEVENEYFYGIANALVDKEESPNDR